MTDMLVRAPEGARAGGSGDLSVSHGSGMAGPDVRVLGPLEVVVSGRPVTLGSRKQRAVLAVLATEANRVVSVDRLVDELWGERPPAAAIGSLHAYVSNLRRILEGDRPAGRPYRVIVTQAPGYVLCLDPGALDVTRFERAAANGRRLLEQRSLVAARQHLQAALAEWRGNALADFCFAPFAQIVAARLEELRLVVSEDLLEVEIGLGNQARTIPDLEALVAEHPVRERLWELLMVALYRSGRQADALRAYQEARRFLGEELGIEPGPGLRRLERDILVHASSLGRDNGEVDVVSPNGTPSTAQLAKAVADLTLAVTELQALVGRRRPCRSGAGRPCRCRAGELSGPLVRG